MYVYYNSNPNRQQKQGKLLKLKSKDILCFLFLFSWRMLNNIGVFIEVQIPIKSSILLKHYTNMRNYGALFNPSTKLKSTSHKLQQRSCYTFSKPCILYSIVNWKEIYHSRDSRHDERAN